MEEASYDSETLLQNLLADYPDLLAGDQIDAEEPRRWLLVSREMAVPGEQDGAGRWSLDHLYLDQDAIPTLVEVKRSSDTRIRREVVGQMLDYAANAVAYWPVEEVKARFDGRCRGDGLEPDEEIAHLMKDRQAASDFWQQVKTNLQAGRVRLVFIADEIPPELRRVVEFLNGEMDPDEVLAIEVRRFVGEDLKALVPRVLGQTEAARQKKSRRSGRAQAMGRAFVLRGAASETRGPGGGGRTTASGMGQGARASHLVGPGGEGWLVLPDVRQVPHDRRGLPSAVSGTAGLIQGHEGGRAPVTSIPNR